MERHLLSFGNHKLSTKQAIWTLPSGVTCIGAGVCRKWCYSKKAERCYPQVLESRMWKLEQSKRPDFVEIMVRAIKDSKRKIVRVHQDGDFYSQEYLDKWKEIARVLPEVTLYAFTKSLQLDLWTNLPKNLIIIQSYGGKFDSKIDRSKNTARVIDNEGQKQGYEYLCPYHDENFTKCGEYCHYCMTQGMIRNVVFLKH